MDQKVLAEETNPAEPAEAAKKPTAVTNPNDLASRFSGNGVLFKGKLFGTADVNDPRGDAVCNTAINLLKTAVKSTGEHKQRIFIRINFEGITLLDAINQLKLYEHPVNKISFISKDPNDTRAFGYIVTEKEGKHTYFGIKTEKAAENVVMSLRDMFQTVFDLKKKEAAMKGESLEKSSAATEKKADDATKKEATPVADSKPASTTEPSLGDATDASKPEDKTAEVKRENSSSHLLELLGDLSFSEPTPQPVAQGQAWPPQNTAASSWGNAVPAQNDPFAVQPQPQQQQQNLFGQPQAQTAAFPQQQPAMQQPFTQPAAQSPFSQPFSQPQAQPMFGQQPAQMFNPPGAQPMFGAAQQQPRFQQQPQAMFQQPAQQSPFAQQPQAAPAQSPFGNDPFSTNGFQQPATQPAAPAQSANNPFNQPTGNEAFGVLQPQQAPQPAAAAPFGQPQSQQSGNLFSDLNPLPAGSQQLGKDQFFSDVKNPPKPKLNEMQPTPKAQAEPVANMQSLTNQPASNRTNTPSNYDWLNDLVAADTNQTPAADVNNQPAGLIPPPPSHVRPRPGQGSLVG